MTIFEDLIPGPMPAGVKVLYGTVTGSSPLRVQVDRDPGPLPVTPTTTVACAVGDRVVMLSHVRADNPDARARAVVIVGRAGGQASVPGIVIGGVRYETSGAWPSFVPPAFSGSSPHFYTSFTLPIPYTPPAGYGFTVHILNSSRYNGVHVGAPTADPLYIRFTQSNSSTLAETTLGWQLVKI